MWRDKFSFNEERLGVDGVPVSLGLRRPQIEALHAALAQATCSVDPATIVMPTGTGKTETMLAIYAHQRFCRMMVVVPTDALRDQISNKFETMGVLQAQGCLPLDIEYPIVLKLDHIPKEVSEVEELFTRANVIVTTISIAGRASPIVQEKMAHLSDVLFIDEAHHISARTWREFRAWFIQPGNKKLVYHLQQHRFARMEQR